MADVRAMLRQERAARQQPTAGVKRSAPAPTSTGIKSSKKRKAEDDEGLTTDVRKRSKAEEARGLPAGFFDEADPADETPQVLEIPIAQAVQVTKDMTEAPSAAPQAVESVNEEEWEKFQREIAAVPPPEPDTMALNALNTSATISAAPMSAAKLAAQAREEQSAQKGQRDAEIEAEKEDAARHLEEEFEEMEELEERVKRLRDKREALRRASLSRPEAELVRPSATASEPSAIEEETDDESDADEWDDWTFRKT